MAWFANIVYVVCDDAINALSKIDLLIFIIVRILLIKTSWRYLN